MFLPVINESITFSWENQFDLPQYILEKFRNRNIKDIDIGEENV